MNNSNNNKETAKSRNDVMQLAESLAKVQRDKKVNNQMHQLQSLMISNADMFKVQAGKGEVPMDNKNNCGAQQG